MMTSLTIGTYPSGSISATFLEQESELSEPLVYLLASRVNAIPTAFWSAFWNSYALKVDVYLALKNARGSIRSRSYWLSIHPGEMGGEGEVQGAETFCRPVRETFCRPPRVIY